jgi:hypothetical protein
MITVSCPACKLPMEIEDNDTNTEWECPTCAAAFVVQQSGDGNLQLILTEPGKPTGESTMIATTGNEIAGRPIARYIGIVRGLVGAVAGHRTKLLGRAPANRRRQH